MDNEVKEALDRMAVAQNRMAAAQFMQYEATQRMAARTTPANMKPGTFTFNSDSNATLQATWHQLVPRNPKRKRIIFWAINYTFYFALTDQFSISDLGKLDNNVHGGVAAVAQITLTAGSRVPIETTSAVFCAAIVGSGSTVESTQKISWIEEVFTDVESIPLLQGDGRVARPGELQRLTPRDMALDGDEFATYGNEGLR